MVNLGHPLGFDDNMIHTMECSSVQITSLMSRRKYRFPMGVGELGGGLRLFAVSMDEIIGFGPADLCRPPCLIEGWAKELNQTIKYAVKLS